MPFVAASAALWEPSTSLDRTCLVVFGQAGCKRWFLEAEKGRVQSVPTVRFPPADPSP